MKKIERNIIGCDKDGKKLGFICDVMGKDPGPNKFPSFLTTERFDGSEYMNPDLDRYRYTIWDELSLEELIEGLIEDSEKGILEELPKEIEYIGIEIITSLQNFIIYFLKRDSHKSNLLQKSVYITLITLKDFIQ